LGQDQFSRRRVKRDKLGEPGIVEIAPIAKLLFAGSAALGILPLAARLRADRRSIGGDVVGNLPIQPYDFVMLAVLVAATLFGLWKGMAWQIASVASLVVSFFVAVRLSGVVAPHISAQEPWNRFIAMLGLYIATSAAIWLAFRLVAGIIDRVRLKEFDHQVGALFGLAKGALLCLLITFFAVTLSESLRQAVLKAYSGRYIAILIKRTSPIMPSDVQKYLGTYIDELDRKLDPATPPETPQQAPSEKPPAAPQRPKILRAAEQRAPAVTAAIPAAPPADEPRAGQPEPPRQADPPRPFSEPAAAEEQEPEEPLFPVRLPSRDRT
jgi:membrane protein required for colicin V production